MFIFSLFGNALQPFRNSNTYRYLNILLNTMKVYVYNFKPFEQVVNRYIYTTTISTK